MKKFFIVLLCVILCVVVSCKTPKTTAVSPVEYEETEAHVTESLEPVDSANAFDGTDFTPEPIVESQDSNASEAASEATSEVSSDEALDGASSEEVLGADASAEATSMESTMESTTEMSESSGASGDETAEVVTTEDASAETQTEAEPTSDEALVVEASSEGAAVEATDDTVEQVGEGVDAESSEALSAPGASDEVKQEGTTETVSDSTAMTTSDDKEPMASVEVSVAVSSANKPVEEVPSNFTGKVVFYGNKAWDFVKNNVLFSIGLLSMLIGVIWLIVDLIKYIVKSIKANKYEDDNQYYEAHEVEEPKLNKSHVEKKNVQYVDDNEDHEFQDEDEFLRSLLNTNEDL